MVGAGSLVTPLLGWPHWLGVILVGVVVIMIVATAGMASTTYVQFLKGALLIIFSFVLVFLVLNKGLFTSKYETLEVEIGDIRRRLRWTTPPIRSKTNGRSAINGLSPCSRRRAARSIWSMNEEKGLLEETLFVTNMADGTVLYNGAPKEEGKFLQVGNLTDIQGSGRHADRGARAV